MLRQARLASGVAVRVFHHRVLHRDGGSVLRFKNLDLRFVESMGFARRRRAAFVAEPARFLSKARELV